MDVMVKLMDEGFQRPRCGWGIGECEEPVNRVTLFWYRSGYLRMMVLCDKHRDFTQKIPGFPIISVNLNELEMTTYTKE